MPKARSPLSGARYAIGDYNDLVTIQQKVADEWEDVAGAVDVWARVFPLSGYERLQAQQLQSAVNYRVAIRDCPWELHAGMRFVWTTHPWETTATVTLNIQAVIAALTETICDCVEAHA
jgi:head-tail adaptor